MSNPKKSTQSGSSVDHHGLVRLFVVLYDDDNGISCPMAWDDDCEGAIRGMWAKEKIATFASRKDARKSIDISAKFAALQKAQGKLENTDFTEFRRNLKVVELHLPNDKIQA